MKLTHIAIVLASCALAISIIQPAYNYFADVYNQETGKPSFNLTLLYLDQFYTSVDLFNNGTATAHHIEVSLDFSGPNSLSYNEFILELGKDENFYGLTFPIGEFHLQYGGKNITQYTLTLSIRCEELGYKPVSFTYNAKPGLIVSR